MKRFVLAAVVGAALLIPTAALAKEPSEASIKGPGFSKTLKMKQDFESSPLGRLTMETGFFPAAESEEHTSELQSLTNLVCRLLLEKKKTRSSNHCSLA